MTRGLEVAFAGGHIAFPDAHLSRTSDSFDGTLAASQIRDADPAATPPEIRTLSGETLFVSAVQRQELERFCLDSQIPVRKRADIWGDLLEPFIDTEFTPERDDVTRRRLREAGLADSEISRIRALVGPLMRAYNAFHWDWFHLGLADLLDALTADSLSSHPQAGRHARELRDELGGIEGCYGWAMSIANRAGPGRPGAGEPALAGG